MTRRPYAMTAAYLSGLVALTFFINHSALSGSWRFDDGWLLDYASRFSPLDYFLNPAITRGYSLNNLTPFNPLIYDLNLWLFELWPKGFYIQHLATLAGCAMASFLLLRTWVSRPFAFLGAATFLAGAPSLFVAQQLMVGHYITGLFFSILAIYAYLQSLDRQSRSWVALSALFYLLATTCKEVYFPLPLVLLFFQQGRVSTRIYHALPMFIWSACYLLWRFMVLGSFVGGYDAGDRSFSIIGSLQSYASIPSLLLGGPYQAWAAILALSALIGYLAKFNRLNIPLLVVALLAVLLPLAPLTNFPGISQPNRYLLLPWWLISITLAVGLSRLPVLNTTLKLLIGLLFFATAATHAWQEQARLQSRLSEFDAIYEFFLDSPPERIFYSAGIKDAYYLDTVLNGARNAQARIDGGKTEQLGILVKESSLPLVDTERFTLWSFDRSCDCIRNITDNIADGKRAAAKPPSLIIVSLSPPYPPLFETGNGVFEISYSSDKKLLLHGHSVHPAGDLEQELILITPKRPKHSKVTAYADRQESPGSSTIEFRVSLNYPDKDSAHQAANQSCLLIRSALTPVRLLSAGDQSLCQGLLSQP